MKKYIMQDMIFEWDDSKNVSNIKKHNVSFELAARAFTDQNYLEYEDIKHSNDELRYILLGLAEMDLLLFVVYTKRGTSIRLISARKATEKERRAYYEWL